jgi:AraC-like DNA-binding protein
MKINRKLVDDICVNSMFCRKFVFNDTQAADFKWVIQARCVLAMITGGKGKVEILTDSGIETVDKPLRPFLLPSYIKRRPVPQSAGFEVLASDFQVEILHGLDFLDIYDLPLFFPLKDEAQLRMLILRLFSLNTNEEEMLITTVFEYKSIYFDILKIIIKNSSLKKNREIFNLNNCACVEALEYINKNFKEPIDIKQLQKMCNLSQAHFFRLFKKDTGLTPFNYLKQCRLEEAQKLLLITPLTVSEIAGQVGWNDTFHFSRIFKKNIGLSPLNYRKQMAF